LSRVLVAGLFREVTWVSEFNVGSLVHPSSASDIRAELIEMGVGVGAKTYIRQNRAVLARTDLRPHLGS
jgi:hypothetical protein